MKKILRGIAAVISAAAVGISLAVGAFADYVYDFGDTVIVDEIKSDEKEINGTEITLTKELGPSTDQDGISVRFVLFNEYLDAEFWNDPNVSVSVDVKLETEGADVIGYMPAFDNKWNWIDPSEFTTLKYGEYVTITESGEHFYEGFKDNGPNRFCFQVRTNWGAPAAGVVTISLRNFTISDGTSETVIDPETGETTVSDTSENNAGASDPAESDTNSTPSESVSSPASTTSMVVADAPDEQVSYVPVQPNAGEQTAMVIIIIVAIAAVVVVGAVVGYIIYKKRKYY